MCLCKFKYNTFSRITIICESCSGTYTEHIYKPIHICKQKKTKNGRFFVAIVHVAGAAFFKSNKWWAHDVNHLCWLATRYVRRMSPSIRASVANVLNQTDGCKYVNCCSEWCCEVEHDEWIAALPTSTQLTNNQRKQIVSACYGYNINTLWFFCCFFFKCSRCKINKNNIIISDRVLIAHCVIESGHAITHVTEVYCRMNDVPAKLILV